jgi:DNA polymerase I
VRNPLVHLTTAAGLVESLSEAGVERASFVSVALARQSVAFASEKGSWVITGVDPIEIVRAVEVALRPRWVWWSSETWAPVLRSGQRVAMCWDLVAVHRLLFGGWRAEPARIWAVLHSIPVGTIPTMGQMGLLDVVGDEGADPENPVRPDGHLRPEWTDGVWDSSPERQATWAQIQLEACVLQRAHIASLPGIHGAEGTARSESAAELLCRELEFDGLPLDVAQAVRIITESVGPRPRNDTEAAQNRERRDDVVLSLARSRAGMDLRNPAHVKAMLTGIGIDVSNTRKWRLEPFRHLHPFVDALLTWRKAERIGTTYGYGWLDEHVGSDGRLRGGWTSCDGAAGRMTAQAGLHNLPAEMRPAVIAEPGFVFVHADLGQIEPRVLAAVSGDNALAEATAAEDLYAPVAARLGVERAVAKIAVLAAMYGQTSGAAGEALRGMETNYPVAMRFLRDADANGQAAIDVRTYGGRLVKMSSSAEAIFGSEVPNPSNFPNHSNHSNQSNRSNQSNPEDRHVSAARGRYARNAVIQGAAAELFKAWAVTIRGRLAPFDGQIVLCLHDELLIHVPTEHGALVAQLLEDALPQAAKRWMPGSAVRYVAKANLIHSWSEAKG